MRLIERQNDGSVTLTNFLRGSSIPPYAILSHLRAADEDEVTFDDLLSRSQRALTKPGYEKIRFCVNQTRQDGLGHFFIWSCCVDDWNADEVSEALNSIYHWFATAQRCYVYLTDITARDSGGLSWQYSRWFTREWTLQELLAPAPPAMEFFTKDGHPLGSKAVLAHQIAEITGIHKAALQGEPLANFTLEQRMDWQKTRETSWEEDSAYCLLGVFNVTMPILYGEGRENAFKRLRKEIRLAVSTVVASYVVLIIQQQGRSPTRDTSIEEIEAACLASLQPVDQSHLLARILDNSKNACQWVFQHERYEKWYTQRESAQLLILANAGCGKSKIAAHIISTLLTAQSRERNIVLRFFFQRSNDGNSETASQALGSMIAQLMEQLGFVMPDLRNSYDVLVRKGGAEWTCEMLNELAGRLVLQQQSNKTIFVVVDAIDECQPKARAQMISWLNRLSDSSAVRVVVTGRPEESTITSFARFSQLVVSSDDTAADMKEMIKWRLEALGSSLHPENLSKITTFLLSKAEGMFFWTMVQLKALEQQVKARGQQVQCTTDQDGLPNMPLTLAECYESMLCKLQPSRIYDMWRIIRWVFYGSRSLTVVELEAAFCFEIGVTKWSDFETDLASLRGSLISVDEAGQKVSILHQMARAVLETGVNNGHKYPGGLRLESRAANEDLATVCIEYLLQDDLFERLEQRLPESVTTATYMDICENFLRRHPLLAYSINHWMSHARQIGTPSRAFTTLVYTLLASPERRNGIIRLLNFIRQYNASDIPISQTPLHLAVYFDFPWLAQMYVHEDKEAVHATTAVHETPLILASKIGSLGCIELLLKAESDKAATESHGWSALHWAVKKRHAEIVVLLLEDGADIMQQDRRGKTPMAWAVEDENIDMQELLKPYRTNVESS